MSARPNKRPRTRSVARRERDEPPTLASVLLPIVQEGFLGHQELGRLSQTSRQLRTQCKEELWKTLCFYRWVNTAVFPGDWIDSRGGYSGWYRYRMCTIPRQPVDPPPLDPPSLIPEDFQILADLNRGGESLVSVAFNGKDLSILLEYGSFRFDLDHPVVLGKAVCFLQGTCNCDARCHFNLIEDDFDATMHLNRSDGTTCRIYQSMKWEPRYFFDDGTCPHFPSDESSKEIWKNSDYKLHGAGTRCPEHATRNTTSLDTDGVRDSSSSPSLSRF